MPDTPSPVSSPSALLTQVLEERYAELRRFALRKSGSAVIADEVMQDAWVRLAKISATTDATVFKNPLSYIHRTIANLIVDKQRQQTVQGRYFSGDEVPDAIASETPSPFQVLAGRQEMLILQQALRDLPDQTRDVFLLYRVQGLTMKEIGVRKGLSVRQVEGRLAEALSHCRARLKNAGRAS